MRGSCLCGGIAWESDGPLVWNSHCHCSRCRKATGAAFATFASADARNFRWLRGQDLVSLYPSAPGSERPFCSVCGAVVPQLSFDGAMAFVPLGNSDDEPSLQPQGHIYVASKAPWFELPDDGLPRFDTMPAGMEAPDVAPPPGAPPATREGVLRGSCLCGAVTYETGPGRGLVYCHCSRCRKGRSAAFGANVFAESGPFRYTRGADRVRSYKVPEAARFTVAFCTVCGGGVPRAAPGVVSTTPYAADNLGAADGAAGAPYVVVPAGSLDDDPGPLPRIHIFVGSKAPWFTIADHLEHCDEYPPGCASSHEWVARQ
jgi:hypothetical protein